MDEKSDGAKVILITRYNLLTNSSLIGVTLLSK
jgi:hypothetical protein